MVVGDPGRCGIHRTFLLSPLTLTQKAVEKNTPGATIIPIFISTDETLVTSFCGKKVYPVYVTIGNVPKEIRRKPTMNAHVLLRYLPVTNLGHMDSDTSRHRAVNNLFHTCMHRILRPLEEAGETGVQMRSGNGDIRRCHPILAVYAADHPEQCLVTCTKISECPKGMVAANSLGENARCYLRDVVEFEGLECAFASFLSSVGSLGVHLEVYTSRLVGCLLGELDNQLHRL